MSNEEILREQLEAAQSRETWPRAMEIWDASVVLLVSEGMPAPGTYYGTEAVGRWFAEWLTSFEDAVFEVVELEQGSDALAIHVRHTARGKGSGLEASLEIYYAYWFRQGKAVRAELYTDRESAWRAAGVAG